MIYWLAGLSIIVAIHFWLLKILFDTSNYTNSSIGKIHDAIKALDERIPMKLKINDATKPAMAEIAKLQRFCDEKRSEKMMVESDK
jgi:hypothetical protein